MAKTALPIQPPFVCVALLSRKKSTECCRVCLSLLCLPLRSRSPHNAQHFTSYWGERERAPTLLMSMEIMYVRAYVPRPRPTARLRMRERCSNSADLAGFRNQQVLQLFVSGTRNVPNTARKRPSEETGTTQATGPRQAC